MLICSENIFHKPEGLEFYITAGSIARSAIEPAENQHNTSTTLKGLNFKNA